MDFEIWNFIKLRLVLRRGIRDIPADNGLDNNEHRWEIPIMNATVTDSRRRLVMPPELPARSPVIVEQIDEDTWVVKRARPGQAHMVLLLPDVKQLPQEAEWQETESKIVAHNSKAIAPFEE